MLLSLLTFVLWLATVALGFWAVTLIREAVDAQILAYIFEKIENQELGTARGGGMRSIVNYATIGIGVLVWIALPVIAGMDYHFKRVGERNSYRLFAWTLGIELALIAVCSLLLAA
jgi:hypothetical protein